MCAFCAATAALATLRTAVCSQRVERTQSAEGGGPEQPYYGLRPCHAFATSRESCMPCARVQIRALMYIGALSNGILEALASAERALSDAILTPVRIRSPPPPQPSVRPGVAHALRLPLLLERFSAVAARLPLHRRNSPILEASEEGDESSHGAGSVAGASAAEEQAALEVRPRGGVCRRLLSGARRARDTLW